MEKHVLINRDNPHITILSLNRPEKRNALNIDLMQELLDTLLSCKKDKTQRVIVLKGEGSVFCTGLDLLEAQDSSLTEKSANLLQGLYHEIYTSSFVTIAAVHGAAIAGGAGLMLACDLVVADNETQFGFPETKRGLVPAQISVFLSRQVKEKNLRELLLVGELFEALEAKQYGLVNKITTNDNLLKEALNYAEKIIQCAPQATAVTKKLIQELSPTDLKSDQRNAYIAHKLARESDEAQEGMRAFFEKREPRW